MAEAMRRRLAQDANLYPELAPRASRPPHEIISISSSSTSSSAESSSTTQAQAHRPRGHRPIIIDSSDEEPEEENHRMVAQKANVMPAAIPFQPRPDHLNKGTPAFPVPQPYYAKPNPPRNLPLPIENTRSKPIHIPSNKDLQLDRVYDRPLGGETIDLPDIHDDYAYTSPAEAEKALRDLMKGAIEEDTEIDMADAVVKGFREEFQLLPHQIQGRKWMREREDITKKRTGGILADDMGLGKTIQTLARISEGRAKKSDAEDGWDAPTLIVCPLSLVGQWEDETKRMTKGLKVIQHHGPSRTTDPDVLRRAHMVITTYDIIANEYDSYSSPAKDESSKPKAKSKSKKRSSDSDEDEDDDSETFGRTVKGRKVSASKKTTKKKDALFHLRWWRVVLDEAHNIKNEKTNRAVACCALEAKFRWCLTGTPMQNNVVELYSLIKFLRIKPLSTWSTFNDQIAKPVKSGRGANRAMKRLQVVLKQIMLRRTKDQQFNGKAIIELPDRKIAVVSCEFDASERAFYTALETKMGDVIEKLMAQSKANMTSVLVLLLRLRQACNHPVLVAADYTKDLEAVDPKAAKAGQTESAGLDDADDLAAAFGQMGVTRKCQICLTELSTKNTGSAPYDKHCVDCVPMAIKAADKHNVEDGLLDSAKIRTILRLLSEIDVRSNGEEKTIIFSQFTSMLDLIQPFLKKRGIEFVRYDGSMSKVDREASLSEIKTSNTTRCILISFKAGSTGLNLTSCNNVILVDLWWNPALEDQAFDRAHRYGQTRDVNIFKLKIDSTVEDRILLLQEKKRELAKAALSGDKIKGMKVGVEELLALFRPGGRDDDEDD